MTSRQSTYDTDPILARAVAEHGDEAAFRELYRRYTPRLLAFVSRLLARSDTEAEDVVQETWIRACGALSRFRWDASFSSWLLGIGLNVVRDTQRKASRSRVVAVEMLPEAGIKPFDPVTRVDLERAIQSLPDGCRMVLVLHDVEGLKHREIAGRLEISEGTSKSQLSHARQLLRAMLSRDEGIDHA